MPNLRIIPSIEQLRQRATIRALEAEYGHEAIIDALRDETAAVRQQITAAGRVESDAREQTAQQISEQIEQRLEARLQRGLAGSLRAVINATGVIIHTNLGRAPLAEAAARRVAALASGYTNLEYDLEEGRRGARDTHAEALLCRLTGAEAALVVNNNAAATMLILAALAAGREVIISRGELVEIGGGFRIPEIMEQSGATLREVGTTNKTRAADYAAAINDRTGLILRVHQSNFRIEGFTERPDLTELVGIGRKFGVLVAEDLGSGYLRASDRGEAVGADGSDSATASAALADEPDIRSSVESGADAVCFSGDKLLGGPQAGVIVGRREVLRRVRTHPLMRALRVDKMTYAALEATLLQYARGRARHALPVAQMIAISPAAIEARARAVADRLDQTVIRSEIIDGFSAIGGGSAPGAAIPTRLLAIEMFQTSPDTLETRLGQSDPPVIARIEHDRVVLDLRTVLPDQDAVLVTVLASLSASSRKE